MARCLEHSAAYIRRKVKQPAIKVGDKEIEADEVVIRKSLQRNKLSSKWVRRKP